uniref:Uncharacterized protein n=1 Tax=Branchiostoma floridae TaxID=7739 RepID=C3XTM7_BRAFL|eukprot:XP_002612644.1 hypothetical protein BRAFLDRAFT_122144 [Branchiostoma floridae]
MTGCDSENGQSSIVKGGTPPGQKGYKGKRVKGNHLSRFLTQRQYQGSEIPQSRPPLIYR